MGKKQNNRGQALVEVALTLPVLGLGIAVAVLLIAYGHNQICLQLMAAKTARRMTVESPSVSTMVWPHPLWGRVTVPSQKPTPQVLEPWRLFRGMADTVDTHGQLVSIEIKSQLLPGLGFSRNLPILTQRAQVEALLEPPRPEED
jgi:hypothetical protein